MRSSSAAARSHSIWLSASGSSRTVRPESVTGSTLIGSMDPPCRQGADCRVHGLYERSIFRFAVGSLHGLVQCPSAPHRSEEHTSELQSLMRISYAVFCLKKKKIQTKLCNQ